MWSTREQAASNGKKKVQTKAKTKRANRLLPWHKLLQRQQQDFFQRTSAQLLLLPLLVLFSLFPDSAPLIRSAKTPVWYGRLVVLTVDAAAAAGAAVG